MDFLYNRMQGWGRWGAYRQLFDVLLPLCFDVFLTPFHSYGFHNAKVRNDHAHTWSHLGRNICSTQVKGCDWLHWMCECASTTPSHPTLPPHLPGSFYLSHRTAGIRLAFGRFIHSGSLSEQEEIALTSRVRVLLAFMFFLVSVSLCVLQPVWVSHIPQVMTHYPSTQNTVSPCYFTAMIKSSSHTCCFISRIL